MDGVLVAEVEGVADEGVTDGDLVEVGDGTGEVLQVVEVEVMAGATYYDTKLDGGTKGAWVPYAGQKITIYLWAGGKWKAWRTYVTGTNGNISAFTVKSAGKLTREVVRALVRDIVLVSEADLEGSVALLLNVEKTVAEGAGAAALAAVLAQPERYRNRHVGLSEHNSDRVGTPVCQ